MTLKKICLGFAILGTFACKKEKDSSFHYDFKVVRSIYSYDPHYNSSPKFDDSVTFYYDNNKRILKFDKYYGENSVSSTSVEYLNGQIKINNEIYELNAQNKVCKQSYLWSDGLKTWDYNGNELISEKSYNGTFLEEEHYYCYKTGKLYKDSSIRYYSATEKAISIELITLTDTLANDFITWSYEGLYEYPSVNKYLPRTSCSYGLLVGKDSTMKLPPVKKEYSYTISDNEIIRTSKQIDLWRNEVDFVLVSRFKKINN